MITEATANSITKDSGMHPLLTQLRPVFVRAGLFSLAINLLLLVPSLYMLQLFDRVLTSRSSETLLLLSLAAGGALVVMAALDLVRARLLTVAGLALDKLIATKVLHVILDDSARFGGTNHGHGLRDVGTLRTFLTGPGVFALFDAPWLPIYILLIFLFHPILGFTALLGATLMIGLALLNERLTRRVQDDYQRCSHTVASYLGQGIRNAELISSLGMTAHVTRRWQTLNEEALAHQRNAVRIGSGIGATTKFVRQGIQIVMLGAGAYLVIETNVTPGVMMAATIILGRALQPVELLIVGWKSLVDAYRAYARLDSLLNAQNQQTASIDLPRPRGSLSVERVVFAARPTGKVIIKGVTFDLGVGESLGLTGPSASGKSTLARLIIGIWKPVSGTVRLDSADVSSWSRESLGTHLGYLPQDVELFAGTVAENIARLGEVDSIAVIAAANRAHVHEMILRLPQGYDTQVGEAGMLLSAGQRQRIALARALYGHPSLVVLDEPNANLDSEGEVALLKTLATLKNDGITLLLITHQATLLAGMDKVLILNEGAIEAYGPRKEVVGQYVRQFGSQRGQR